MVEWSALVVSIFSLIISYLGTRNTHKEIKNKFINELRINIKKVKYEILKLDELNEEKRIAYIENIRDLLFYQCCIEEKDKYLSKTLSYSLDILQEEVEDAFGFIVSNIDAKHHRTNIVGLLNTYMEKL